MLALLLLAIRLVVATAVVAAAILVISVVDVNVAFGLNGFNFKIMEQKREREHALIVINCRYLLLPFHSLTLVLS